MDVTLSKPNYLLVITGPPASGKSTLGLKLAEELQLPFISKDNIKELLFDALGWKDRNWSKELGRASLNILYHVLEMNLQVKKPLIIETAFYREEESEKLRKIKRTYSIKSIQIYCFATAEVLRKRFLERVLINNRHPGHGDIAVAKTEYDRLDIFDRYGELDIGGSIVRVDTSDFSKVEYEAVFQTIKDLIGR
ncbi:MAG: AAA family ATPase [Candidatus Heimdallarchaeota archaeon]